MCAKKTREAKKRAGEESKMVLLPAPLPLSPEVAGEESKMLLLPAPLPLSPEVAGEATVFTLSLSELSSCGRPIC